MMNWLSERGLNGRFLTLWAGICLGALVYGALLAAVFSVASGGGVTEAVQGVIGVITVLALYIAFAAVIGLLPCALVFGVSFRHLRQTKPASRAAALSAACMVALVAIIVGQSTEALPTLLLLVAPLCALAAYLGHRIYAHEG